MLNGSGRLRFDSQRLQLSFPYLQNGYSETRYKNLFTHVESHFIVQELCESRGGRPGLSVLTSLLASVDVKI